MLKRYVVAAMVAGFGTSYGMEIEPSKTTYIGILKALFAYNVDLEDARQLQQEKKLYFSLLPKDILGIVQKYRLHELLDKALRAQNRSEALSGIEKLAQFPEYAQVLNNPQFIDGLIQKISSTFGADPERVAQDLNLQGAGLWLRRIRPNQIKLLQEAKSGNLASVQQLIASGVNVNARNKWGETALVDAAWDGRIAIVEELIAAGANVNARDKYGKTALMRAAYNGHTEVVKVLIAAKADVNAQQSKDGQTALIRAALQRHVKIVKVLLVAGADVNAQTKSGWTALMWSACNGCTEIVQLLIAAGASVTMLDKQGKTAFDYTRALGHKEIVELLKKATQK